ncbi:MAG TPA: glycosyltransferase [Thermoleophilaceae bacterium]|jgi:glycosyltransferase involved in cell wall biosynthesis
MPNTRPLRVLLICSGLDHAHRGFESFARECFDALRDDPALDMKLVKGSGAAGDRERSVPTLTRDSAPVRALARLSGRQAFRFEHVAFAFSVMPVLLRERPDVVFLSEWHTGKVLAPLRDAAGRSFALVLSNGTMALEGFGHLDRVQELSPAALEEILARGADPERHVMLPLGFWIDPQVEPVTDDDRRAARERLGLPLDRRILLSSAALNRHHKRLDYLIEEVASLPEADRPYVLMAGQVEEETEGLRALARERLGPDGHDMRTVPQRQVPELLRSADEFVLASLGEGLPRALIEALAAGLPCLTHDYGVTRYALGEHGHFADFSRPGGLAGLIAGAGFDGSPDAQRARHRYAYEKYSWEGLRPRYVELFRDAARAARARRS